MDPYSRILGQVRTIGTVDYALRGLNITCIRWETATGTLRFSLVYMDRVMLEIGKQRALSRVLSQIRSCTAPKLDQHQT